MKLHQLKYFLAVAQTRNFTRAAERCNVAQPSLSRAIQELEVELGGSLFKRLRGQNDLTPLGRFVHRHIQQVDEQLSQIRIATQCWRSLEAPLHIGVQNSIGAAVLTGFIADFGRMHPRLDIEIRDADADALEEGIECGVLDLAFAVANVVPRQRLAWHPLFREPMMIAFAGGHRFGDEKVVRLHDLDGEAYVDHLACERRQEFERELSRRGIEVRAAYRSNRADWVLSAVAAGLGIAIAPRSAIVLPSNVSAINPVTMRIPWIFEQIGSLQNVFPVRSQKISIHGAFLAIGSFLVNNPG